MPEQSSKQIFEVSLSIHQASVGSHDILRSLLLDSGVEAHEIVEDNTSRHQVLKVYFSSRRPLNIFRRKMEALKIPGLKINVFELRDEDWLTRWKKDWKPFRLTTHIDVVPVWCQADYKAGRRQFILLDTISSFGTGLHETTQFMAEFIDEIGGNSNRFLDIGTGTGILTLVALKKGIENVLAIDIDDLCIDAAQANFKVNGYTHYSRIIHTDVQSFNPSKHFDFVCANLVTHDLIQMKRKILSLVSPGGWLALSGISLENLSKLKKAFSPLPLRCISVKKGKQWAALLFKKDNEYGEQRTKKN